MRKKGEIGLNKTITTVSPMPKELEDWIVKKTNASLGKELIITGDVVPNEPFDEDTQLALDIYAKALKGLID